MDVTCELERELHRRQGGNVVLGVRCAHGTGRGAEKRPDLSIAAALDRSASMKGSKIEDLIVATGRLVDALGPSDRLVLVAFDSKAEVLAAGPVVDRARFHEAVRRIECRSGTNISLALETAGLFLKEDTTGNVKRVLLLTDGEASKGDTSAAGLARIAETLAKSHEIATTCLGFGLEYDEDTLALIAGAGAGRLHHVSEQGKLSSIYEAELERMRDLVAPWITVTVLPVEGARVHGARNNYPMKRVGRGFELELSDLRSHEARWVLFDVAVPPGAPGADEAPLGEVIVRWRDTRGETHERREDLVVRYADDAVAAQAEANGHVLEQIALLDIAAAKARALRDADEGHGVEGSIRFGTSLARIRSQVPGSSVVRDEVARSDGLTDVLRAGTLDPETRKRVVVEIRESESPTFRVDLGDAPPL